MTFCQRIMNLLHVILTSSWNGSGKGRSWPLGDFSRLLWLLAALADEEQVLRCGVHRLTDEVEREIRSNANQARRVTPTIASLLSEVAILAEYRRQIAASRPWFVSTRVMDEFALIAEFEKRTAHVEVMTETLHQLRDAKLGLSGTPLSKFKYPSEKRLTAATTKEMRDAEDNHC